MEAKPIPNALSGSWKPITHTGPLSKQKQRKSGQRGVGKEWEERREGMGEEKWSGCKIN